MKQSKKLLSLILVIVMILGLLPTAVFAAPSETALYRRNVNSGAVKTMATSTANRTVILACSDIQEPENSYLYADGDYTNQVDLLNDIMSQVKTVYPSVDAFFCGGDYNFDVTREGYGYVENGVSRKYSAEKAVTRTAQDAAILSNTVKTNFPAVTDENIVLVQGNHDQFCDALDQTGGYDMGTYSVYVINEKDYPSGNTVPAGSPYTSPQELYQHTADCLRAWLTGLVQADYNKPVFILTHVPLHFSNRLIWGNDAIYAQLLYDAIESHGNDLNIIFMYGHDHGAGDDDYLGGASQFLTRGDKIFVAQAGNKSISSALEKTLNFTYMNYGFVGYYWNDWDPNGGPINYNTDYSMTMTTFEINGNAVTIRRFDEDGQHILKAAGAESLGYRQIPDSFSPNTKVYESPQTVVSPKANAGEPDNRLTFVSTATGVSVKASGTALTVTAETNVSALTSAGITDYLAYDITVDGFSGEAEITLPTREGFNKVWYITENDELEEIADPVFDGDTVTFVTNHFSRYATGLGAAELGDDLTYFTKTATPTGVENYYDIELSVESEITSEVPSIVILFDVSSSMEQQCAICGLEKADHETGRNITDWDGNVEFITKTHDGLPDHEHAERLSIAKNAALTLAAQLYNDDSYEHCNVKLITFGGTIGTNTGWFDVKNTADYNSLVSAINGIVKKSGTSLATGMEAVYNSYTSGYPQSFDPENSYVIVLSDGSSNYSTSSPNHPAGPNNEALDSAYMAEWLAIWDDYPHYELNATELANHPDVLMGPVWYADQLHDMGALIYSVVFGNSLDYGSKTSNSNWRYLLSIGLDNDDYMASFSDVCSHADTQSELETFFSNSVGGINKSSTDIVVADPMTNCIEFLCFVDANGNEIAAPAGASFDSATKELTWDVSNDEINSTLYYRIRVQNESFTSTAQTQDIPTNGTTRAEYTVIVDGVPVRKYQDAVIPTVDTLEGTLEFDAIDQTGTGLAGIEYTLTLAADDDCEYDPDYSTGNHVWSATATSDADGHVTFTNLPSGHQFTLTETENPYLDSLPNIDCSVEVSSGVTTKTGSDWDSNGDIPHNLSSSLTVFTKTSTSTSTENNFDIELAVESETSSEVPSIVILIDVSSSMEQQCAICGLETAVHETGVNVTDWDGNTELVTKTHDGLPDHEHVERLGIAKNAALNFAEQLRDSDSYEHCNVKLITFGGTLGINSDWFDVKDTEDYSSLESAINGITKRSGTSLATGMEAAYNALTSDYPQDFDPENSYVIVLSDGSSNYSTSSPNHPAGPNNEALDSAYMAEWLAIWDDYPHYELNATELANHPDVLMGPVWYADQLRSMGTSIYSVVFGNSLDNGAKTSNSNWRYLLSIGLDNDDYMASFSDVCSHADTQSELESFYLNVAGGINKAATDIVVTDQLADNIEFLYFVDADGNEIAAPAGASFNSETKVLTWNVSNDEISSTLHYRIRVQNENFTTAEETQDIPTGETATAEYTVIINDSAIRKYMDAESPTVDTCEGTLEFDKFDQFGSILEDVEFTLTLKEDDGCEYDPDYSADNHIWSATATSDADGHVTFTNIPSGHRFTLTETENPHLDELPDIDCEITVSYGSTNKNGSDWTEGDIVNEVPVFYVVHHAVHVTDEESLDSFYDDFMETIPMYALDDDDGYFDITVPLEGYYGGIREGYIYGGMYEGERVNEDHDSTAIPENDYSLPDENGWCGKELEPEAWNYYYLREVSEEFLQPRIISLRRHVVDTHVERYLVTAVDCDGADNGFYTEYGFNYNPNCDEDEIDDYMQSGVVESTYDTEEIYAESADEDGPEYDDMSCVLYEYIDAYKNNSLQARYEQTNVYIKSAGFSHISNDDYFGCVPYDSDYADAGDTTAQNNSFNYDFHYTPYYVTADGVYVAGIIERYTDISQAETVTAASNYDEQLESGSVTYCHHSSLEMGPMMVFACFMANPDAVPASVPENNEVTVTIHANAETRTVSAEPGDFTELMEAPELNGLRFVGWYADENYTVPAQFTDVTEDTDVYVRYIDDAYFTVQMINTISKKKITKTRVVTVVDERDNYQEVGLEIAIGGKNTEYKLSKDYASVNGYSPVKMYGNSVDKKSRLIYQDIKLDGVVSGTAISITPYYITADGSRVYGKTRNVVYFVDHME